MTGYGNIQLVTIFAMKYGKNNHQLRDLTVRVFLLLAKYSLIISILCMLLGAWDTFKQ